MNEFDRLEALLIEIRDLQKRQLEHAKNQSDLAHEEIARSRARQEESLRNQKAALQAQKANGRLYRLVVSAAAIALVLALFRLFGR
jgi:hypothetical protein